jgi:hypothetical protein
VEAAAVTVVEVDIVVVLVFGATSPFSSFLISSLARDDVELRRLNFVMFRARKSGFRTAGLCKKQNRNFVIDFDSHGIRSNRIDIKKS